MSSASSPPIRLVIRLLLEFMVSAMPALARWHGGDLVRGVIFLAIAQANRPRLSDPVRRAGIRGDEDLRPISVMAIAQSLRLPYETARRRVRHLERLGLVERREQGIVVPGAVIASREFEDFAAGTYALFLRMLRGLRAVGFDFASFGKAAPLADSEPALDEAPDAAVRHVVIDFILRMVECGLAAHDDDFLRALIFSAIMSANAEPYTADPAAAWNYATLAQSPPEHRRKPVTVAEIAARTGIPYETTRRYVAAMLRDKDVVRVSGKGVINPQQSPRDARLHQSGAVIMSRFIQLIGDLTRLGFSFDTLQIENRRTAA